MFTKNCPDSVTGLALAGWLVNRIGKQKVQEKVYTTIPEENKHLFSNAGNKCNHNRFNPSSYYPTGKRRPHSIEEAMRRLVSSHDEPLMSISGAQLSYFDGRKRRSEKRESVMLMVGRYLWAHVCLVNLKVGLYDNQNVFQPRGLKSISRATGISWIRSRRAISVYEGLGYIKTDLVKIPVHRNKRIYWRNEMTIAITNKFIEALGLDRDKLFDDVSVALDKFNRIEVRKKEKRDRVTREQNIVLAKTKPIREKIKRKNIEEHERALLRQKRMIQEINELINNGVAKEVAVKIVFEKYKPPD